MDTEAHVNPIFKKKIFWEYHQGVKEFGDRSGGVFGSKLFASYQQKTKEYK